METSLPTSIFQAGYVSFVGSIEQLNNIEQIPPHTTGQQTTC